MLALIWLCLLPLARSAVLHSKELHQTAIQTAHNDTLISGEDSPVVKELALVKDERKLERELMYDDYGGRILDPHHRGIGRRPPRPRCHLSTLTKLQLVTITLVVHPFEPSCSFSLSIELQSGY